MKINQKKLDRQTGIIQKWITEFHARGTVQAITGFGKTFLAILAIERLHKKYPDAIVHVVVPGTDLREDWIHSERGHITKFNLNNVEVFVINTYITSPRICNLLILDEVHNYAARSFSLVFHVTKAVPFKETKSGDLLILALTATLERRDGKHLLIEQYCPIVDTVDFIEAKREGYISDFLIFNWGLEMNEEDTKEYNRLHTLFNKTFASFGHNFELAMACATGKKVYSEVKVIDTVKENGKVKIVDGQLVETSFIYKMNGEDWRNWFANKMGFDGSKEHDWHPKEIAAKAAMFNLSMRGRKTVVHTATVKIDAIKKLCRKFPVKALIFSETSKFADLVEENLGSDICKAYHTNIQGETRPTESLDKKGKLIYKDKRIGKDKIKKEILESFADDDGIRAIASVRALDEGYDNYKIRMAIMASYNSSKRQDTQRTGRGVRTDDYNLGKLSLIINLYIINTQEEKWLKDKQHGKQGVKWVKSIDEINYNSNLFINLTDEEKKSESLPYSKI